MTLKLSCLPVLVVDASTPDAPLKRARKVRAVHKAIKDNEVNTVDKVQLAQPVPLVSLVRTVH